MARTLLISERGMNRSVGRAGFYEFEDVVKEIDDVDVLAPAARARTFAPLTRKLLHQLQSKGGIEVRRSDEMETCSVEKEYKLLFVLLPLWTGGPLRALQHVRHWRKRCRFAVCWVSEIWKSRLLGIRENEGVRKLRTFDLVLVGQAGSVDPMSRLLKRPCIQRHDGIDALRFCPYPNPPERYIDVYNMGRRAPQTHEALLAWAQREGRHYLFDTLTGQGLRDYAEHRWVLANLLKRTKFFVVNRAHVDNPQITGGQHELGLRFFEGAAAGTIMIGEPPTGCAPFERLFNWQGALTRESFGSKQFPERIQALERDPEHLERVRQQNVRQSLLRFDWSYAWREILKRAGLAPLPGLQIRETELQRRAELIGNESTADAAPIGAQAGKHT